MKLHIVHRDASKKSETTKLRREGFIPSILYRRGEEGVPIAIKTADFSAYLRNVRAGHLPTTIFTLIDQEGKERRVIIKDIQYEITTYDVTHLDFEELVKDQKVNVKVPIECVGAAESPGVKGGGALRQVIRHVRIRCLPQDLPSYFELDVRGLDLRQSKRLSDLTIPDTIRPLMNLNEVAAVIVKR